MMGQVLVWAMAIGALYGFVQLCGDLISSVLLFRRALRDGGRK